MCINKCVNMVVLYAEEFVSVHMSLFGCIHMYRNECILGQYMCLSVYMYVYVYMWICVYVCMCICIYINHNLFRGRG